MKSGESNRNPYGRRAEYSLAESEEFEQAKDSLVDFLEYVTFEDARLRSGSYRYRSGITQRDYVFIREESDQAGAYPIENMVSIYHQRAAAGCESYGIRMRWRSVPAESDNAFETDYLVERYDGGTTHLTMWEMDMGTETVSARTMTPYDVQWLLREFGVMADSLQREFVDLD